MLNSIISQLQKMNEELEDIAKLKKAYVVSQAQRGKLVKLIEQAHEAVPEQMHAVSESCGLFYKKAKEGEQGYVFTAQELQTERLRREQEKLEKEREEKSKKEKEELEKERKKLEDERKKIEEILEMAKEKEEKLAQMKADIESANKNLTKQEAFLKNEEVEKLKQKDEPKQRRSILDKLTGKQPEAKEPTAKPSAPPKLDVDEANRNSALDALEMPQFKAGEPPEVKTDFSIYKYSDVFSLLSKIAYKQKSKKDLLLDKIFSEGLADKIEKSRLIAGLNYLGEHGYLGREPNRDHMITLVGEIWDI